jgi:hypothetical protein
MGALLNKQPVEKIKKELILELKKVHYFYDL